MEPEYSEKEVAKGVKHFDEEIPPEADVRREIREGQLNTIGGAYEEPRITHEIVGKLQEAGDDHD